MNKASKSPFKPLLSLCMIVKNESRNLPRCLASAKPYVDEMVVVDTGSQDNTREIALQYGARIEQFEWCDDFASARNYALSQVSGDWILALDADEELIVESKDFLIQLESHPEIIAYSLNLTEADKQSGMTPLQTIRLFSNIPELRYNGRFHEQLKYQNQAMSDDLYVHLESIRILHYGYSKEQVRQKNISRNIPILESIRRREGLSLMLLYSLAEMYINTHQQEKAQECYAEAFERLFSNLMVGNKPRELGFVPSLVYIMGKQTLQQKDYETAILICQRGLEWYPNFPPMSYLTGATMRALGFLLGATAYFENCLRLGREGSYYKGEPFDLGYMTIYPAYDLGCVYMQLKRWQEALETFKLVLSFNENFIDAQQQIDKIHQILAF